MSAAVNNAMLAPASAWLPSAEHNDSLPDVDGWLRKVTVLDVLDQLCDAQDALDVAIRRADAHAIGRIVLAVRHAYAQRLADMEHFDRAMDRPGIEQVAAMALYTGEQR